MTLNVDINKLFEYLRKLSPLAVAIGCTTGFILLMPEDIRQKLHIADLPEIWYKIIGIIFILSIFLIVFFLIDAIISFLKNKISAPIKIRELKKRFLKLNQQQKDIICALLQNDEKYVILSLTDGNANYLVGLGFIYRPKQEIIFPENDHYGMMAKYLPHPWLLSEYNKNPSFFFRNT